MNKTALITGASSGLGAEFAKIYGQWGYNLVLVARRTNEMLRLKDHIELKYGVEVLVITMDLTAGDAPQRLFAETQRRNIHVDVLVNNAGFGALGKFMETDLAKQQNMVQLNVSALMSLTHHYLAPMVEKGHGKILNVASIAGFAPGPGMAVYYATKAFVLNFSDALSTELKGTGVTVTALCPGPVNTGFANVAGFKNNIMFSGKADGKAAKVCRYGVKMLEKGKAVAVPGMVCRAGAFATRFVPREFAKWFIYKVQTSRFVK